MQQKEQLVRYTPLIARLAARSPKRAERKERAERTLRQYYDDPLLFADECVIWRPGESLTGYQRDILASIVPKRRVSIRSPHGAGKTMVSAILILWFALTRNDAGEDWKIPTTASAWRQLKDYLWPEVHKWARRLRWGSLNLEGFDERTQLHKLSLSLSYGQAFALASDQPALLEGAHADQMLYIFDEAKVIRDETFDAAEGALSADNAYALMLSTPGEPNGRFYEVQSRKPGYEDWHTRYITQEEVIAAGRMSPEWAAQRALQWGANSAVYKNRVAGEFASSDEDGVIPLSWIEAANERWHRWNEAEAEKPDDEKTPFTCVGVDVGRGEDQTVLALRFEDCITELRRYGDRDTMPTVGYVVGVLDKNKGKAIVDVIGIGAGVYDRLKEQGKDAEAFNAAEGTDRLDRSGELGFNNTRSAAWWSLREQLDPAFEPTLALPPDDLLTGDLTAPKWRVVSGGKIQVEAKDDIRKRLNRSTDSGDAVVQAMWTSKTSVPSWWLEKPGPRQRSEMEIMERLLGRLP